jgi:hypothetical protein
MSSRSPYGTDQIPQALVDRLREVARDQDLTTYGEVAPYGGIDSRQPHFDAVIGRLLDDVNRAEIEEQRPMLSAVVINKDTSMPWAGFFNCARELRGYSGNDDLAFWAEEVKRVYAYWTRH